MIRSGVVLSSLVAIVGATWTAGSQDAADIVRVAIDNWRGQSSYGEMTMTIHRPSWERTMSVRAWTQDSKESLVRVTAPKKDAGNGTLMVDNNMWSHAPKVNRVIEVPSSMKGQSWMGSDFSNRFVRQVHNSLLGQWPAPGCWSTHYVRARAVNPPPDPVSPRGWESSLP